MTDDNPLHAGQDREDDPRDAFDTRNAVFLALNTALILFFILPMCLNGGLENALPYIAAVAVNAAIAFLPAREKPDRISKVLYWISAPCNGVLAIMAWVLLMKSGDGFGQFFGALTGGVAVIGLWKALQFRLLVNRHRAPRKPAPKWLRRVLQVFFGVLALLIALLTLIEHTDAPCTCRKSAYAATATEQESKALNTVHNALLRMPVDIGFALAEKGGVTESALAQLDFSLPGDAGYRANGALNVFRIVTDSRLHDENVFAAQQQIDLLTGVAGARIIFNLRRYTDAAGHKASAIFAIIPGMKYCDGTVGYIAKKDFKIAKDNRDIVESPADFTWDPDRNEASCVRTADSKDYYFQLLDIAGEAE